MKSHGEYRCCHEDNLPSPFAGRPQIPKQRLSADRTSEVKQETLLQADDQSTKHSLRQERMSKCVMKKDSFGSDVIRFDSHCETSRQCPLDKAAQSAQERSCRRNDMELIKGQWAWSR